MRNGSIQVWDYVTRLPDGYPLWKSGGGSIMTLLQILSHFQANWVNAPGKKNTSDLNHQPSTRHRAIRYVWAMGNLELWPIAGRRPSLGAGMGDGKWMRIILDGGENQEGN